MNKLIKIILVFSMIAQVTAMDDDEGSAKRPRLGDFTMIPPVTAMGDGQGSAKRLRVGEYLSEIYYLYVPNLGSGTVRLELSTSYPSDVLCVAQINNIYLYKALQQLDQEKSFELINYLPIKHSDICALITDSANSGSTKAELNNVLQGSMNEINSMNHISCLLRLIEEVERDTYSYPTQLDTLRSLLMEML